MDFTAAKRLFAFRAGVYLLLQMFQNSLNPFVIIMRTTTFFMSCRRVILYQALSESLEMHIMAFVEIIKTDISVW